MSCENKTESGKVFVKGNGLIILVSVSILSGTGLFLWQSKTKHSVATII